MKYGNRSLWQRFIASPISLVVLAVLLFILARATVNIHGKADMSAERLDRAQAALDKLSRRQADMAERVSYLSTDQGMEAEIRTRYHAVKEGESVAVIVDTHQPAAVASASSTQAVTAKPNWFIRLLRWIGL